MEGETVSEEVVPGMSLDDAAEAIGVTSASLRNWIDKEYLPVERSGRRIFIDSDVVQAVQDLREEHGRSWHEHASWNSSDGASTGDESAEAPTALNAELLKLAKKFRAAGQESVACKLYDALLEQYDF